MRRAFRDRKPTCSSRITWRGSRNTPISKGKRRGSWLLVSLNSQESTSLQLGAARCPISALGESLLHFLPIDHVPPRRDVIRPLVLVLQVVGVLPHIESHDRLLTFHQRVVLVRRAGDREFAALVDQPHPARSEASHAGRAELLAKFREVAERALDGRAEISPRLPACVGTHNLPEHRVVPVATTVVSHRGSNCFGNGVNAAH